MGTGKVSTTPQDARVSFTVEQKGATQEEAKNAVNKILDQTNPTLTSLGIKKTDIKTVSFSVNPNYEMQSGVVVYPGKQVQNGYVATAITQIKGTVNQINKAVDALSALGTNVGGVEYVSTDQTKLMQEAQAKAIDDAHAQAENIAQAAGFRLGKIASIRDASQGQYPQPFAAGQALKAAPSTETNLQPGQNEVTAQIGVTYYIND